MAAPLGEGRAHVVSSSIVLPPSPTAVVRIPARGAQGQARVSCQCRQVTSNGDQNYHALDPVSVFLHPTHARSRSFWEHRFGRCMDSSRKGASSGAVVTLNALLCDCPGHCEMCSPISGLCPLHTAAVPLPSCAATKQALQASLSVLWEGKSLSQLKTSALDQTGKGNLMTGKVSQCCFQAQGRDTRCPWKCRQKVDCTAKTVLRKQPQRMPVQLLASEEMLILAHRSLSNTVLHLVLNI